MRHVRNPQMELGEIGIENIRINLKSRDDIPALLLGLQHLYSDEETRSRLFALLEEHMLPGVDRTVGRPGMELWRILVMGVVMQGSGCDFDRLHELVNEHNTLRQFLGHADIWDKRKYEYQTVVDNVCLVRPELLAEVGQLVKGFEVMRALRKDQAGIFALQGGIVGEVRIVERAFDLGPCALTEAVALLQDCLANAES